jgi:hypothetical protein
MTQQAYHKSSPSIHRPHVARFPRKTWQPGEPLPGVAPNAQSALERDAENWSRCAACDARDRIARSLAVELDRVSAENGVLREELERAA